MNTTLLVEAKREYTEQLVIFLRDAMYDEFYLLWKDSVESSDPMMKFQERLEEIVDWDEKTMIRKTDQCVSKTGCKFLDDLITAVFVAHMKILMSIKNTHTNDRYRLQVPTTNKFIYECMIQCSREFWKSPYLFYQNESENKIKKVQIQKNLRQAEMIITDCVKRTIRGMLPVKEIVGDVFEYDKDGDLILDVQRSRPTDDNEPVKEPITKEPSEDVEEPDKEPSKEETKEPVKEETKEPSKEETKEPSKEETKEPVKEETKEPVKEETKEPEKEDTKEPEKEETKEPEKEEIKGPVKEAEKDEDVLGKTIENIRIMNSGSEDREHWEYDPTKSSNDDNEEVETQSVDWNKGFAMGPIEEDLHIETEPLDEPSKEPEVDLGDVIELR
jgi:DNA polymerase III gamma/tau subunit